MGRSARLVRKVGYLHTIELAGLQFEHVNHSGPKLIEMFS